MKKYAVYTENTRTAKQVAEALEGAGFSMPDGSKSAGIISINAFSGADGGWASSEDVNFYVARGFKFILPSYVIAHAAELDGAKKPWEVAPEGYRLVTDEERKKYTMPADIKCHLGGSDTWSGVSGGKKVNGEYSGYYYAIPIDFTFEPRKVTMAQVCAEFGENVVIEKETV